MQVTISREDTGDIFSIEISESLTLSDFKIYLQAETDLDPSTQIILLNGNQLQGDSKELQELGIKNDDLLVLVQQQQQRQQQQPASAAANAATAANDATSELYQRIELSRQQILNDPNVVEQIRFQQPDLHATLNDATQFRQKILDQMQENNQRNLESQQELARLQADPDDPENQARILELIRQEQIEENMKLAWEISPESFTSIHMLYIKLKINGVEVTALVDSGAGMTTISEEIAEKVGITRLIDTRFQGQAVGVGSQKIKGKIHNVAISIGDDSNELPCSFHVVNTSTGILFGLDMLRRHRCVIDLEKDVLIIGKHIEAKFLTEFEAPKQDLSKHIVPE
ncbi:DNA damage-inducible protein 1 [Spathaspora sp. JA1]|nr:DNA damage-inducible protein 1 [Spathaspora sp. JA1]